MNPLQLALANKVGKAWLTHYLLMHNSHEVEKESCPTGKNSKIPPQHINYHPAPQKLSQLARSQASRSNTLKKEYAKSVRKLLSNMTQNGKIDQTVKILYKIAVMNRLV